MAALESQSFDSGTGVTLRWPQGDDGNEPHSFNHECIYQWVGASDCGYDLKRILPDRIDVSAEGVNG